MRTIQSPGVEINEIDISQIAPSIAGTKCLVMGFADRGEDNTPYEFTSRNSFLNYYGEPTNEAEYYFYDAANEILQQNGGLIAARLPYVNTAKDKYKGVFFEVDTASALSTTSVSSDSLSTEFYALSSENLSGVHKIRRVSIYSDTITQEAVDGYRTGTKPSVNRFVIINKNRDAFVKDSTDRELGGIFAIVTTPFNALANQGLVSSSFTTNPYNGWNSINYITDNDGDPLTNVNFVNPISGVDFQKPSLARSIGALFPTIQTDEDGKLEEYFLKQIMIVVCRTFEDVAQAGKTGVQILESFAGSLNPASINNSTGESIFIDDIVNENSNYIEMYSDIRPSRLASNKNTYKTENQNGTLMAFTDLQTEKTITFNSITSGINQVLDKVRNIDQTTIDVVVDAGLSTIANMIDGDGKFDPTSATSDGANAHHRTTIRNRNDVANWRSICTELVSFCKDKRKDCLAVIDGPRNLVLQGNEKIERPSAPTQLVDVDILPKIKYLSGLNSSYGTGNIMWMKSINEFSGETIYLPPSNKVAGVMVYTDRVFNYWDAPAGFNRGRIFGVNDIAFNPYGRQSDLIYTKNWNYAKNYPVDGIVIEGQKTLQTRESAFDRVNVRRLFLRLERLTYNVLRYFVYEPNNFFTRTQIVDILTPVFENVKVAGGLFDYKIICSEKNNTPDVIDRNELKIAIMLKPTRTAEFILADFYALRTGASFNEVIL